MTTDWNSKAESGFHTVSDFRFDDGHRLDVTLAYHTLGSLNTRADNAVMLLHGTTGSGRQFLQPSIADFLFGSGRPLDVTRFFVIMPDAIGHGRSSRPSEGLGPDFPHYGYGDMVEGQHRLLAEGLGIERLRLLLGTSMGGMQTWIWGQRYPDQRALMAVASLPERITGRNLLWRRMLIHLIESDPGYAEGRYNKQPAGVGHAMALFRLMVGSARHMASDLRSIDVTDRQIEGIESQALDGADANDVIWEFDASRDYDPAPGLQAIRAPLLAVNFEDDELNPVELGGLESAIAEVPHGRAITLPAGPKTRGHQTLHVAEVWCNHLAELLAETGG
ncbi:MULTISPECIES: alpha/beta fold hydrolase [unclassified Streptomyces]|uniref:alpha/beta fold hydrolase n=1 Tax=unclassified Streptomyces TaxID=2593676 RepID=UPI00081D6D58|nr:MULTISPECIES: alpha/beta fold hydrolase [unclassified Streptomyces]MYZ34583.1 alpha/beta fold hydrolase [Streptomyces sp. SID4917]SCF68442.1 homoserine O-acetyltransferase [Streptomyces sp. MnatMP-M17]